MSAEGNYERGPVMLVRIVGHTEPTYMTSILRRGFVAGGGLMLVLDHGNGEIENVIKLLNDQQPRKALWSAEQPDAPMGN